MHLAKIFLILGGVFLFVGGVVYFTSRWGRIPGDIVIEREGFTFFLPLGTCLIVSIALSVVAWFFRRSL